MDTNKKVLIFMSESNLKPIGGPSGYLFNLKMGLSKMNVENVEFLRTENSNPKLKKIFEKFPLTFRIFYQAFKRYLYFLKLFGKSKHVAAVELNNYEYVHFHSTASMYAVRDSLKEYKGKVILTSHTPKPYHLEIIQDTLTNFERKLYKNKYFNFMEIDEFAFNNANYIIFPCAEAEDPYRNNWKKYDHIKKQNLNKYRYLLTGIKPCSPKITREEVLKKYKIPEDAFVVSYVGRHNETKGYDHLKSIGEQILAKNEDTYFLIAGVETPLTGLKHKRWVEVGWTNDPHSLISASDVFVLPNKETYFDLVMLEVLSLGNVIIASNTGGNQYFSKIKANGVLLYDKKDEAIKLINDIKRLPSLEKVKLEKANKKLFEEYFTMEAFSGQYINTINNLERF
jgi:glycosyltransferase involved in cell wall biosynthesis